MNKADVITGATAHQVSWSEQDHLATSKRPRKQGGPSTTAPASRRKRTPTTPELKKAPVLPIPEQTGAEMDPDLQERIEHLVQATERLRAELDMLARSSDKAG